MALNQFVSEVLLRKNLGYTSRQAAFWLMVNLFLALSVTLEMYYGCYLAAVLLELPLPLVWRLEMGVLVVSCLNLMVHMARYLHPAWGCSVLNLTDTQKRLLSVNKNDPAIGTTPRADRSAAAAATPLNYSALSWLSRSDATAGSRMGSSASVSSWAYQDGSRPDVSGAWSPPGSPYAQQWSGSPTAGTVAGYSPAGAQRAAWPRVSTPVNRPNVDITDMDSFRHYMDQYEEQASKYSVVNASAEASANQSHSFWNQSKFSLAECFPSSPSKHVYQLSIRSPCEEETGDGTGGDKKADGPLSSGHDRTWVRLGVSRDTLFLWTENLRVWMCQTIFVPLVKEIETVNAALKRHGLSEVQIGEVGLEKLRKTCQLLRDVPSLNAVLHFLSVTTHQEYLVYRIRELSLGGCVQEFRWNGGGTFRQKAWDEHLPTDSAIVMHMVASYMDTRLPPHPTHPDGRTFSNDHVIRVPDVPSSGADRLVVHQAEVTPPRFCLLSGGQTFQLAKGRNNLFHTLLLFLYMVREKHDSMLDKIHIGPTGLNMLWIIE